MGGSSGAALMDHIPEGDLVFCRDIGGIVDSLQMGCHIIGTGVFDGGVIETLNTPRYSNEGNEYADEEESDGGVCARGSHGE